MVSEPLYPKLRFVFYGLGRVGQGIHDTDCRDDNPLGIVAKCLDETVLWRSWVKKHTVRRERDVCICASCLVPQQMMFHTYVFKLGSKNPYLNKHFLQQPHGFGEHLLTFDIIFFTWETHATTVSSALSSMGGEV